MNDIKHNRIGDTSVQHEWVSLDKANALVRFRNASSCVVEENKFTQCVTGLRFDKASSKNVASRSVTLWFKGKVSSGIFFIRAEPAVTFATARIDKDTKSRILLVAL